MASASLLRPASHNPTIYITGLAPSVSVRALAEKFGTIGRIKTDKRSGDLKIYVYNDKATNTPKGDGTVTFEDPNAATAAVDWFNNTDFLGQKITVQLASEKEYIPSQQGGGMRRYDSAPQGGYGAQRSERPDRYEADSRGMYGESRPGYGESRGGYGDSRGGRGGARAGSGGVPGEWDCVSCGNMNFAKRIECFRCHAPKPVSSAAPPSVPYSAGSSGSAQPNLEDWTCMACANINWGRRTCCNRCNAPKPAITVEKRTGRGGGYNERDTSPYGAREPYIAPHREYRPPDREPDRQYRGSIPSQGYEPHHGGIYPEDDYGYTPRDRAPAYRGPEDRAPAYRTPDDRAPLYRASEDRAHPYRGPEAPYSSRPSNPPYRQAAGYRRERSRSPRR